MPLNDFDNAVEKAMDSIADKHPDNSVLVMAAMREARVPEEETTYPVVIGCRKIEAISDPMELAEILVSCLRSLRSVATSILGEKDGDAVFAYICAKSMEMEREDGILERENWTREEGSGEWEKDGEEVPPKSQTDMLIEGMVKNWKDFLKDE